MLNILAGTKRWFLPCCHKSMPRVANRKEPKNETKEGAEGGGKSENT